jgi:hypothetical protein
MNYGAAGSGGFNNIFHGRVASGQGNSNDGLTVSVDIYFPRPSKKQQLTQKEKDIFQFYFRQNNKNGYPKNAAGFGFITNVNSNEVLKSVMVNYQESNLSFEKAKDTLIIGSKFLFVNHKKEIVVFEVEKECSKKDKDKGFAFVCVQVNNKKQWTTTYNERRSFAFLEELYKSNILSDENISLVVDSWSLLIEV